MRRKRQTNYEAGRYYEYRERDRWRAEGWWSERQYGSYGVFDVLATNGYTTVFMEIKSSKRKVPASTIGAAKARLKTLPKGPGIRLLLVLYEGRPARRKEIRVG